MATQKCIGTTHLKNRCKRYPVKGTKYCPSHTKIFLNTECPICLCAFIEGENDEDLLPLECGHILHKDDCILKLSSFKCPICRAKIKNKREVLGEQICSKISKNVSEFRKFIKKENASRNREISEVVQIQDRRREEIESAIDFLKQNGVPRKYIPRSIAIEVADHPFHVPPGYFRELIFQTTRVLYGEKLFELIEKMEIDNDPNIDSLVNIFGLDS
ncbi:RING finger protein [bacterium]|nr:RING finger protein [bacterium]